MKQTTASDCAAPLHIDIYSTRAAKKPAAAPGQSDDVAAQDVERIVEEALATNYRVYCRLADI